MPVWEHVLLVDGPSFASSAKGGRRERLANSAVPHLELSFRVSPQRFWRRTTRPARRGGNLLLLFWSAAVRLADSGCDASRNRNSTPLCLGHSMASADARALRARLFRFLGSPSLAS